MNTRVDVAEGLDAGLAWHFGNPLREQREAERAVIDLGNRELFKISGPERLTWLDSLTTGVFKPGEPAEALVLNPQGHIEHGFHGVDDGETFWAWTEPGGAEALVTWLEKMKFWTKAEVELVSDRRAVWVGNQVDVQDELQVPDGVDCGRLVLSSCPDALLARGNPTGLWAYEALRIGAGVPRIGVDTDQRTIPNELGLYATVLGKGCYLGQETVGRVQALGRPPRRLVRLLLDGSEDRLPAPGSDIELDGKRVGAIGSVAHHHELGPVGLGLIKRSVPVGAVLQVAGLAASQEVIVDPDQGEHFRPNL